MESLLKQWDGESVLIHRDPPTGTWLFIAIHSTRLGPAAGGTRLKAYADMQSALQDALRLARSMTYKFAAVDFPWGGGKAVIAPPPDFDSADRPGLLRRYGALLRQLGGLFYTGPDVGTSSADMDLIAETGAPYVFSRTEAAGGAGDPGGFTALGLFTAIQVTCQRLFGDESLAGRRILVQGAGNVGRVLIERLRQAQANVLFSDIDETTIQAYQDDRHLNFVPADRVYYTPCDIFAPCALGGILNETTIARLRCRAVVGSANNQLARPEDAERLRARNILYAPDFVVNVGGAMAITGQEAMGWSADEAKARVVQTVRENLPRIFELAEAEDINPDEAARRLAEARLARG